VPKKPRAQIDRDRLQQQAATRIEKSAAEERALDAAVRQSIKLHGA
jgi:hypothetical protein